MSARFAVGIDLGTTHTVVAWTPLDAGASAARTFDTPQIIAHGQLRARSLFPSALYAPLEQERGCGFDLDPFGDAPWVLGEHARRRGAEVPGRLVASSKSWLVHPSVDRTAAILPWDGSDDVQKLSPVDAATRLLAHVRRAWDAQHEDAPLAEQDIVLTVPASFDEVARELTIEAARRAGIAPKLLEEPQAAFYDWMTRVTPDGVAQLLAVTGGEALVLVVDVGGGTTDLSLVRVSDVDQVARVAVGPHLLLGGDNMDLALAHACEPDLVETDGKLGAARFAQLVAACRMAKESLLGMSAPADAPVTVIGGGASLVGNVRTTRLTREAAERIVLDGFFPSVAVDVRPHRARGGITALGLPYERDTAITTHVAAFLARHLPAETFPNAVLLAGGVFRASGIAERLIATLSGWHNGTQPIERLSDAHPELAVACGAVAYALARRGQGVRIGGGTGRGYFVGIGNARAVCVVPRGAEEGATHVSGTRTFALAVGRPVRFDLFASDSIDARAGDVVGVDAERFIHLPPLVATIDATGGKDVQVSIEGEITPVGTLDLACVEVGGGLARHFRLAFQLREQDRAGNDLARPAAPARTPSTAPRPLDPAFEVIDRAFGKPRAGASGRQAKDMLREIERVIGERTQWTTEMNRALFDGLIPHAGARRRSADHERVFWMLASWCLRPGFGDPLDPGRVAAVAMLFDARLAFPGEARGWQQFWIAWRRVAAGLDQTVQTSLRDFVDGYFAPAERTRKSPKKPALSLDDALDMASSLERVDPSRRVALGGWVLERTWIDRDPRLWVALGRIGARVPGYASVHHVIAPHVAERWLDHALREKWQTVPTAAQAAVKLARRTDDRARDVGDAVRREVERRLIAIGADDAWIRAVRDVVPVDEKERAAFYGETLPLGLRLVE